MTNEAQDKDPVETQEWLDSIEDVLDREGPDRAHFLLDRALRKLLAQFE